MVQAISASDTATAASAAGGQAAAAAAALEAQLAQYQQQLSDCVNCDSSKTLEGKQQIQTISSKISAVKKNIEQAKSVSAQDTPVRTRKTQQQTDAAASAQPSPLAAPQLTGAADGNHANNPLSNQTVNAPKAPNLTVGVRLDTFA